MRKLRVYIGCALTHAPEEYKKQIALFKDKLREVSWIEVLDFWNASKLGEGKDPDPHGIYCTDIHDCVGTADAIIGELSYPSTGLGWELGASIEKHKIRVLMCAHKDALVSNLPIGAALHEENKKHVSFYRYKNDINELFDQFIEELNVVHMGL